MNSTVRDNFLKVTDRICEACNRTNRDSQSVRLVVVTKGQLPEKINEVLEAGANQLGENYPEQTIRKIPFINSGFKPSWHMIGHIQSRKIKFLLPNFSMIHSIDSVGLAQKLDNYFLENRVKIPALIEVNLSGEKSKFGFNVSSKEEKDTFFLEIERVLQTKNLSLNGLMTMPPNTMDSNESRKYFARCRELLFTIQQKFSLTRFTELSMGTSMDFEVAIEEGATLVRIGEAIMGKRENILNGEG
jgi:PLP dependent protein